MGKTRRYKTLNHRRLKWEKPDFVVAASKMRGKFAAEQLRIASSDKDVKLGAQQTVHKHVPSIHILDFVQKQIRNISAIQLIDARQNRVEVFRLQACQTVVVKVHIRIPDASFT